MKQSAKVFIWIGMIIQFFLIYPIIIGIFALKKIDEASTKNDLQTFGILTTFFCSLLGGIFMLNIKDEELTSGCENTIISKTEKTSTPDNFNENKNVKRITQIGLYSLCAILPICLLFCIVPITEYNGSTFIPLIFNFYQIALFIPIIILYCINKQRVSKTNLILLCIFTSISIALMVLSIVTNYCFAYTTETFYNAYGKFYVYEDYYGVGWEYWVTFGISCITTLISSSIIVLNLIKKQIGKVKNIQTKQITTSKIEIELNEITRLYNNKIITEEEYNKIRASIISKYYK